MMNPKIIQTTIQEGKSILGIEFGSTRIKAVLIDEEHNLIATGSHEWENQLEHGVWTYHLEDVWEGLQASYRALCADVREKYQINLTSLAAIGFSGMMHGYLPFDKDGKQLAAFRTWRNTSTVQAAEKLTELFRFNIPQRWSIAHLYQAILNQEPHVSNIAFLTTLAGYVHWKCTGLKVLGVGEASGMFPIDSATNDYDQQLIKLFSQRVEVNQQPWNLLELLPKVRAAGDPAGVLTEEGARLIDPTGSLRVGIPLCPPEGDAGTGMVATNSVSERTGNVSAGTSVFAMLVLEKPLSRVYPEIDMVTTPSGKPVAMVHCNNCTSDLNAWVGLFGEFATAFGVKIDQTKLFETLYMKALEAEPDCGELLAYNYLSGEHITHMEEGRPVFVRKPDSRFTLANFMRTHLYASLATLKLGLDILFRQEQVKMDQILGHGGFFKTRGVGQRVMAAVMNTPVSVMETADEGGAWGIALLAAYMAHKKSSQPLEVYLTEKVFTGKAGATLAPDQKDVQGFLNFMNAYQQGMLIERAAVNSLK